MKVTSEKENAVEKTLLENYDRYYRLAYSYVHNEADAGDIVQNGAYRAIRSSGSLKQTEYTATWVYRIMLHEIFRFLEKKKENLLSLDDMVMEQGEEDIYADVDLQKAIEQLSSRDRVVVLLRFFEDMKIEDIAAVLEENVSTIKSRLYRSMKKLQQYLENEGGHQNEGKREA